MRRARRSGDGSAEGLGSESGAADGLLSPSLMSVDRRIDPLVSMALTLRLLPSPRAPVQSSPGCQAWSQKG